MKNLFLILSLLILFTKQVYPQATFEIEYLRFENCRGGCDSYIRACGHDGVAPYTIMINGVTYSNLGDWEWVQVSNLCPGTYGVAISDAPLTFSILDDVVIYEGKPNPTEAVSDCWPRGNISLSMNDCGAYNYTYNWSNGATTSSINNLTDGEYTVTICPDPILQTDTAYPCIQETYQVNVNPRPIANLSIQPASCPNSSDAFVSIGSFQNFASPTTYQWSNGNTSQYLFNVTPGPYDLWVTNLEGCILDTSFSIGYQQYTAQISGSISASSGPVTAGNVYLIHADNQNGVWDTLSVAAIQNNGTYQMNNVLTYEDLLLFADPENSLYPFAIPTFYGNTFNWQNATIINPTCNQQLVRDITVLEINPLTGVCDFTGGVFFSSGKMESTPIPNIDIMITKTPPGNVYSYTQTDNSGLYSFSNVEVGQTYHFYVNIPGLPMIENYNIVVNSGDLSYQDLNFYIDTATGPTAGIYTQDIITGVQEYSDKVDIYPNPNGGSFTIQLSDEMVLGNITLEILNIIGQLIQSEQISNQSNTLRKQIDLNVAKGIYTLRLTTSGNVYSEKLIIK